MRRAIKSRLPLRESPFGWMNVLLELPFVGVAIFERRSHKWIRLNDRFCSSVGYERGELLRLSWTDLCHPGDQAECDSAIKRLAAKPGGHVRMVQRLRRKDGTVVHAEIDLSHAPRRHGGQEFVIALVSDVAERDSAASLAHYSTVFAEGQSAMVILDAETGGIVEANPAAESFYGWTTVEMRKLGMHVWDVSRSDPVLVRQRLREAAAGAIASTRGTHRIASGELRDVEIYCGPIDLNGRRCVYGIIHDVTERRRAKAERREAEEKLRAIVEQSIAGIYIIEDGRFSYANPRMAEILGYAAGELVGVPVPEVVAPEDRDLVAENNRRRLAGEVDSVQYEFRARRKDGELIDVGVHGSVANIRGKRVIVGVAQDITERRRAQRSNDEYLHKLEAAMRGAVGALSHMVALRDPYTAGHERRVASLACALARDLGLSEDVQRSLDIAGQVHDIGKISVPSEILSKPTRLTEAEFELVKIHAPNGFDILKVVEFPWPVAEMTHQHHERMDGSGYPGRLRNGQICHGARILAVADVIEAMSSHRPYRPSLGIAPALAEIERGAGPIYDADVAASALRLFRDKNYTIPA
ncbi:MAG: PAS domain S-box protein [Burkholderiales bacterium]